MITSHKTGFLFIPPSTLLYSCLENPRDGGSLVGCHLWGRTESDTSGDPMDLMTGAGKGVLLASSERDQDAAPHPILLGDESPKEDDQALTCSAQGEALH